MFDVESFIAIITPPQAAAIAVSSIALRFAGNLLMGFGLISVVTAAFFLSRQRDIKRMFAYSSIEHMGLFTFVCMRTYLFLKEPARQWNEAGDIQALREITAALTPEQFGRYMQSDIARWAKLAQERNIRLED